MRPRRMPPIADSSRTRSTKGWCARSAKPPTAAIRWRATRSKQAGWRRSACGRSAASRGHGYRRRNCAPDPELFVLEGGLALLDEGRHAFLLVLERELRLEHAPLEER